MDRFSVKNFRFSRTQSLSIKNSTVSESDRRAIGLLPLPTERKAEAKYANVHEPSASQFKELLITIEGNQNTCCLRIICPKTRSRSAVLLYRGRVIGCIYGSKQLGGQLMGRQAFQRSMADLFAKGATLDVYALDPELVVATAALFHGSVMQAPERMAAPAAYEWFTESLISSALPGCIVVSDSQSRPTCMIYCHGGKLVGVYSFKDGWVSSSFEAGLHYVMQPEVSLSASMLSQTSDSELLELTFSLSGLGDRQEAEFPRTEINQERIMQDMRGESERTSWQLKALSNRPSKQIPKVVSAPESRADRLYAYRDRHSHKIKP
jgi:hypothetical protein